MLDDQSANLLGNPAAYASLSARKDMIDIAGKKNMAAYNALSIRQSQAKWNIHLLEQSLYSPCLATEVQSVYFIARADLAKKKGYEILF